MNRSWWILWPPHCKDSKFQLVDVVVPRGLEILIGGFGCGLAEGPYNVLAGFGCKPFQGLTILIGEFVCGPSTRGRSPHSWICFRPAAKALSTN